MNNRKALKNKKGFTLIEVLAVILIIMTITSIVLPNYISTNKNSEAIKFTEELRLLENNIQIVSEVGTENYKHIANPALIDYDEIKLKQQTSGIHKQEGIPYIDGVDKDSFYYIIRLSDESMNRHATVAKNLYDNDTSKVILTYGLKQQLEEKFGNGAVLKAYPLDLETFSLYSPTYIDMSVPKVPIAGTNRNSVQNKEVLNLQLKDIFVGPATNYQDGETIDKNDRIPNDGIVEKPGYYLLIDNGDTYSIIYTGTDVIYKNKYIHIVN